MANCFAEKLTGVSSWMRIYLSLQTALALVGTCLLYNFSHALHFKPTIATLTPSTNRGVITSFTALLLVLASLAKLQLESKKYPPVRSNMSRSLLFVQVDRN